MIGYEPMCNTKPPDLPCFKPPSERRAGATMGGNRMRPKAGKPERPDGNHHIIGVLAHQAHVDGSRLFPCTQCRRQVWMSPASQRLLATGKWDACCMGCGEAAIASGEEFAGAAPGAAEEFYACAAAQLADR